MSSASAPPRTAVAQSTLAERAAALLRRHLHAIDPETCGRGREPDVDDAERDDAMAWSLYARGYALLARRTNDAAFRTAARTCAEQLIAIRSPVDDDFSAWGLPYAWKEQESHHPYGITTAMCGDALLDVRRAGVTIDETILRKTGAWLARGLTWHEESPDSAAPEFSPGITYLATNVAARTAGFLQQLALEGLADDAVIRRRGTQALRYTLGMMQSGGYWFYGRHDLQTESKPKVDNLHSAYVLEGLIRSLNTYRKWFPPSDAKRTRAAVELGLAFYRDFLFRDARGRERVFVVPNDRAHAWAKRREHWVQEPFGETHTIFVDPLETRSWAIGAALTAWADAHRAGFIDEAALDMLLTITAQLETENDSGRFGYKTDDPTIYVRHEAHLFYGLCGVVEALGGRVTAG